MSMASPTLNFCGVLSESKRIINAHSRHFLALSVLFVLPLSFSFIIYPTLQHTLFQSDAKNTKALLRYTDTYSSDHPLKTLALPLIYTLFVLFLSLCAVATITYSTYHGFYGSVLVYLQVNWALACVIVVVESKWGFEPLRRSTYLVRGMRWVSLSLLLFFGSSIGFLVWSCTGLAGTNPVGFTDGWKSWAFIVQTVVSSSFVTLLMLHNAASNAVLYMYCKAMHGELAWEIAEEFAQEYVSLPFDDEKVPHVVSVVQV
ncbi:hypothetical protein F0562_032952 [Nyssa sinensis]|uniref:Uncharacterized protein n=1 Tax=Nyssa sinensis TaxID=561372 RepID=A0A5J5AVA7_9ASTE|nr:hypothetical protein F0562_032952 [Nyssa sinensis]